MIGDAIRVGDLCEEPSDEIFNLWSTSDGAGQVVFCGMLTSPPSEGRPAKDQEDQASSVSGPSPHGRERTMPGQRPLSVGMVLTMEAPAAKGGYWTCAARRHACTLAFGQWSRTSFAAGVRWELRQVRASPIPPRSLGDAYGCRVAWTVFS